MWQIMLGGALVVLATGQISLPDAVRAINPDVMVFLFGMFVVGQALVESGYLSEITGRLFSRAKTTDHIVLAVLFGTGLLSAFLMNDTLAIIGTPLVLALAAGARILPKLLLLALAVAITTGSVMSPIGNPQNLLVAVNSGMPAPFVTFGIYLFIPTLISLAAAFVVLRIFYGNEFRKVPAAVQIPKTGKNDLIPLAKCSVAILLILAGANALASVAGAKILISLPVIAVCAAAPILLLAKSRIVLIKRIDWPTLVFFAAMFVLMESVWQTGLFQAFIGRPAFSSIPTILCTSVVTSQFISNVPFVALFLPMILRAGGETAQFMALAAGSTIAGNLTILGAASNVIIIQNAEKDGQKLSFAEFARVGIPLTIIQVGIYWIFLTLVF
ncbi:MAG: SLC13 family permease [Methanoregula sp.]|uniref:SLC13 family permease n=1 Tax=Methanoregula sp. TaxID=2052170 RepID=UPI003D0E08C6